VKNKKKIELIENLKNCGPNIISASKISLNPSKMHKINDKISCADVQTKLDYEDPFVNDEYIPIENC
jgi:hypothetical protein